MDTSDIIAAFALGVSVLSLACAIVVYFKGLKRERKQATLDAFNELQAQVLDELAEYTPTAIRVIAENRRKKDTKQQYHHCKTLIARIEHFAIGIEEKIYDYKTADKLAAEHLIYLYNKVSPIIEAARESAKGKNTYIHFEKLVDRLQASNPEIKLYHKNGKGEA